MHSQHCLILLGLGQPISHMCYSLVFDKRADIWILFYSFSFLCLDKTYIENIYIFFIFHDWQVVKTDYDWMSDSFFGCMNIRYCIKYSWIIFGTKNHKIDILQLIQISDSPHYWCRNTFAIYFLQYLPLCFPMIFWCVNMVAYILPIHKSIPFSSTMDASGPYLRSTVASPWFFIDGFGTL